VEEKVGYDGGSINRPSDALAMLCPSSIIKLTPAKFFFAWRTCAALFGRT
jgi:hypothetical protein